MYDFLHGLLADREGGAVFFPYNLWHILYLILLVGGILLTVALFKNSKWKRRIPVWMLNFAFALYMADFFLMPFSKGDIDVDKLPFHVCTLMSVLCFFSRHNSFLARFQSSFALLGLIGGLIYVVYPAGVADGVVSVFCYRILQTLLFHGLMIGYGVLSLVFGVIKLDWKHLCKDAAVIVLTVLWAMLGNAIYSGIDNGRSFNWCFVKVDPLGLLPDSIAPYILPFAVSVILFSITFLIYVIYKWIEKSVNHGVCDGKATGDAVERERQLELV